MGQEGNPVGSNIICSFCTPKRPDGKHFQLERVFGLPYPMDQVPILESVHFIVKPDILPLEPNGFHALIIPKQYKDGGHPLAFAELSSFTDEVGHLVSDLETRWQTPILLAEHGANSPGSNHQSVYHAHTHGFGIPAEVDAMQYMKDELRGRGIPFQKLDNVDPSTPHNLKTAYQGYSYLYVQFGREAIIAHDPKGVFPSQITQGAISRLFNCGETLNWKQIGLKGEKNPYNAKLAVQRTVNLLTRCIF